MNKRFYTLMVSIMLAGSAFSTASALEVSGEQFKNAIGKDGVLAVETGEDAKVDTENSKIILSTTDNKIELSSDVDLYAAAEGESLIGRVTINVPEGLKGLVLTQKDGQEDAIEFKGRLVLDGENITVSNLKITNDPSKGSGNTAIVVKADNVTIQGNTIVGQTPEDEVTLVNGIILYPQSAGAVYNKITGNELTGFSKTVVNGEDEGFTGRVWYSAALQVYQETENNPRGTVAEYDFSKNEFTGNDANIVVRVGEEAKLDVHHVEYAVIAASENNEDATVAALRDALIGSSEQSVAKIELTGISAEKAAELIQKIATDENNINTEADKVKLAKAAASINVGKSAVIVGNVAEVPAGAIQMTFGQDGSVATSPKAINWGSYKAYADEYSTFVLVVNGQAVYAEKVGATTTYKLGDYDENLDEDGYWNKKAGAYHFTFDVAEFTTPGTYEVRVKDVNGNYVQVDGQYVTVDVNVIKSGDKFLFNGDEFLTSFVLKAGDKYVSYDASKVLAAEQNAQNAYEFGAAQIRMAQMTASDLLTRYGEYFELEIIYDKDGENEADLTGVFEGKLTPMASVWYRDGKASYIEAKLWDKDFMLVNEEGKILVLNTSDDAAYSTTVGETVYPFELIDAKTWTEDQVWMGGDGIYDATFSVNYTPGKDPKKVEVVESLIINNQLVCCWLSKGQKPNLAAGDVSTKLKEVTISLNPSTAVVEAKKWLNKVAYYTVEVINENEKAAHYGKVLGLDENGKIDFVAPEKTNINLPEGQFAIWYEDGKYTFTNRENPDKNSYELNAADLYKIDGETFAYKHVDGFGKYHMDTLAITPITDFSSADGFKRFSEAELNANTYTVAMNLLDNSYLYVVENHDDKHRIGLDREEATDWRIEMPTVMLKDATWDDVRLVPDTVTVNGVIKYYDGDGNERNTTVAASNKKYANPDTYLKICTYILKNTATDEYFFGKADAEEKGNEYYYCPEKDQATRLALKVVGDSTVNLVPVNAIATRYTEYGRDWKAGLELEEKAWETYAEGLSLSNYKVIGGTTSKTGVLKDVNRFDAVSNDLFVISDGVAPTYKGLKQDDKIVLSREENNDQVIYEKGEFAAIDNAKAYDINPTVYVDTAYVDREGNYRYDYLLVVNPNRIDETEKCEIPSHEHLRTVITEGRFLINMKDSAEANKNVHNNKYMYDGEYKLSFVPGYHQNDTLYFTNDADEVVAKTAVGNAAHNFAKFAFKMINEANNEFVIETGIGAETQAVKNNRGGWTVTKGTPKTGYLRWHNGNLVVTENLDEAEHFTMEASDKDATANDAIAASEVSVIAGNGFVTVKGAEGKNVVITNVLGQTIASTVVSSSEATIAAPAGVVVVAVEGEAAVKAIVK